MTVDKFVRKAALSALVVLIAVLLSPFTVFVKMIEGLYDAYAIPADILERVWEKAPRLGKR